MAVVSAGRRLTLDPLAAHRGTVGLRMVDSEDTGPDGFAYLQRVQFVDAGSPLYLRTWLRQTSTSFSSPVGLMRAQLGTSASAAVLLSGPSTISSNGTLGVIETSDATTSFDQEWHLVELYWEGLGTANGSRQVFIDRTPLMPTLAVNLSGLTGLLKTSFSVGQLSSSLPRPGYEGTIDFDDFRVSTQAPASRFATTFPTPVFSNSCVPFSIGLVDSKDQPVTVSPTNLSVAVDRSTPSVELFQDNSCQQSLVQPLVFAPGVRLPRVISFRASDSGTLTVREPDLFEASASFVVFPQPDAGQPDAGQPDAGQPEAGQPEAGQPDAGQPDAGQPDAGNAIDGRYEPSLLQVGCGCSSSSPAIGAAAGLLGLWRRRRMGARKQST